MGKSFSFHDFMWKEIYGKMWISCSCMKVENTPKFIFQSRNWASFRNGKLICKINPIRLLLSINHFKPMLYLYTPWKCQKARGFGKKKMQKVAQFLNWKINFGYTNLKVGDHAWERLLPRKILDWGMRTEKWMVVSLTILHI